MKHICIKLVTGEELIGTTESDLESTDPVNLDNPFRLTSGFDEIGNYGIKIAAFMSYCDDTLFTFNPKHIILYSYPTPELVSYYEEILKKREKLLMESDEFDFDDFEDAEPTSKLLH